MSGCSSTTALDSSVVASATSFDHSYCISTDIVKMLSFENMIYNYYIMGDRFYLTESVSSALLQPNLISSQNLIVISNKEITCRETKIEPYHLTLTTVTGDRLVAVR